MNAKVLKQAALDLAQRTTTVAGVDARLDALWLFVLNRPITAEERTESVAFLAEVRDLNPGIESNSRELRAWTELCHALLASNEFLVRLLTISHRSPTVSSRFAMTASYFCEPCHRRDMLRAAACGFGGLALQGMMSGLARAATSPLAAHPPHFAPRAKRVIFLFIQGGPSQLDLFDPKPFIAKKHGEKISPPIDGSKVTIGVDKYLALAPAVPVRPRGDSGMMISDLMPHLASVADDLCLLRAVHTDNEAHAPATLQMHTGVSIDVRPSMGSWFSYGLGTENENLPSFITIHPDSDVRTYGSGFLPAAHQGTPVNVTAGKEAAIKYLVDDEVAPAVQRRRLDLVRG